MNDNSVDGFEMYRRQRERRRLQTASTTEKHPLSGPTNALRELEAVEEREHRDMQLRREVHDFFDSATRIAADIVDKVAATAQLQLDEQLSHEMQEFLMDSIARMQDLVQGVLTSNQGSTAEQVIEPLMHNLAGQLLDGFRHMGNQPSAEQHLGKDPMQVDLDDVRRQFQEQLAGTTPGEESPMLQPATPTQGDLESTPVADSSDTIEHHLVAELYHEEHGEEPEELAAAEDLAGDADTVTAADTVTEDDPAEEGRVDIADLKRFKSTLETLVRTGQMTKAEARAAWDARKAALAN
jgi:hypothetical protein